MLFAQRDGSEAFRRYHDIVFERFWRRELDIESVQAIETVLREAGADASGFPDWVDAGRAEVSQIVRDAEALGVFGVPSFILDGELYWGREHLPDIEAALSTKI
jgi:2-hydroxychromene-2-carboxylate isomerase